MGTDVTQSRDSKNTYYKLGLMQGLYSKVFYIEKQVFDKYANIPVGADVDVSMDITEKDGKTYYQLVDLQVVTQRKAV